MIIHSSSQLITLAGGPQHGGDLGHLGIIEDGAVVIQNETITAVGKTAEIRASFPNEPEFDARGRVVMPGFVDPHTHLVWAGNRAAEFEMRLQGKTYLEIQAAGGGIISTVRATRKAVPLELARQTRARAKDIFNFGTTTAEVKTGYGLTTDSELLQMAIILDLDMEGPLEMIPTFLGAHAVAAEYKNDPDGYARLVCSEMLPKLLQYWQKSGTTRPLPFVDVFCETGAFSLSQSRQILETARSLGFPLKIHADEFDNLGGASLAASLGAASADHLVKTSPADIHALAQSNTVAVALPCTPFGLADPHYSPALEIIKENGLLAVASDMNPGTAWCGNMQFVLALACRYLRLTPAQAIAAATINAATAVQRSEKIGSLEAGKQADLLILKVDDYRHLGYQFGGNLVSQVIKRGKFYPME
jgi:imidazolonepropionase